MTTCPDCSTLDDGMHIAADCVRVLRAQLAAATKRAEVAEGDADRLDEAIGVMVPSILRCFMDAGTDLDRETTRRVLIRIESAKVRHTAAVAARSGKEGT